MLILNKLDCIRVHKVFYSISIYRFKAFWITRRYKINFLSLFITFSNFSLNKIAYTYVLFSHFLALHVVSDVCFSSFHMTGADSGRQWRHSEGLQTPDTYVYVYKYTHTHTHTHIHIHTYTHIYTYIYTYTHIHIHTHKHIHTHIHIHTHMVDSKFLPVSIRWYLCGFYRKFHCGASLWVVMPLLTGCSSYSLRMVPCSVYPSPLHAFLLDRKGPVWLLNQFYRKLHASLPFLGQPTIHALLLNSSNSSNYCSP